MGGFPSSLGGGGAKDLVLIAEDFSDWPDTEGITSVMDAPIEDDEWDVAFFDPINAGSGW